MDLYYALMFQDHPQKLLVYTYTWILKQYSRVYATFDLKPAYIRMCAKGKIVLEFSLMWIQVTCFLPFHMIWYRLYLTFHYPIEALYKEPFGYIERRGIEEKESYSPFLIIHESGSLCPLEHFVPFPSFHLLVSLLSRDGGLRWWRPRWRS